MGRLIFNSVIIFLLGASSPIVAQTEFNATVSTVTMTEGGTASVMLVETDNERFSLAIPIGYGSEAHADTRSVVFTSDSGACVITVKFSTNYARALPKQDVMRDRVAANHLGASLVASSASSTGFGPALSFDLFQPASNGLLLRIRDVFAAYSKGSVELTFSCNSGDFDKEKLGFMRLLNSFHSLAKSVKSNP
jgi:hypothetical protein